MSRQLISWNPEAFPSQLIVLEVFLPMPNRAKSLRNSALSWEYMKFSWVGAICRDRSVAQKTHSSVALLNTMINNTEYPGFIFLFSLTILQYSTTMFSKFIYADNNILCVIFYVHENSIIYNIIGGGCLVCSWILYQQSWIKRIVYGYHHTLFTIQLSPFMQFPWKCWNIYSFSRSDLVQKLGKFLLILIQIQNLVSYSIM